MRSAASARKRLAGVSRESRAKCEAPRRTGTSFRPASATRLFASRYAHEENVLPNVDAALSRAREIRESFDGLGDELAATPLLV